MAATGAPMGEGLGITRRRLDVDAATIAFAEQFDRYGDLAPLKTSTSRRTIEITRSLAAALALAGPGRTFAHLTHASADKAWRRALKRAKIADPQQRCTISATHVSGLIADGWDPVEIAARIGDTLQTTLTVYSHEFDARRRGDQRRAALEARYDGGMATDTPQHTATSGSADVVEMTAVQAVRDRVG